MGEDPEWKTRTWSPDTRWEAPRWTTQKFDPEALEKSVTVTSKRRGFTPLIGAVAGMALFGIGIRFGVPWLAVAGFIGAFITSFVVLLSLKTAVPVIELTPEGLVVLVRVDGRRSEQRMLRWKHARNVRSVSRPAEDGSDVDWAVLTRTDGSELWVDITDLAMPAEDVVAEIDKRIPPPAITRP